MENIFKNGTQEIYTRGDLLPVKADEVRYIVSGIVVLNSVDKKKRRNFLLAYKTGDIFPYGSLKTKLFSGRKLEYRALASTSTLMITKEEFEKEVIKPQNLKPYLSSIYCIMDFQMERIDNLDQGQVSQRLLERLNFYANRAGVVNGDKVLIEAQLSHSDIASSIGTTRETVNRLMKKFEHAGIVTVKNQTIIINSLSKLQQMIASAS
jgi:CRP/FNR family cyclic AMP-dependent transcriptional regulator